MISDSDPTPALAGFWRRGFAFAFDLLLLELVGLLICLVLILCDASLGAFALVIATVVPWLYFGLLDSAWGGAATPGKSFFGLRTVGRDGQPLSVRKALGRSLLLTFPGGLGGALSVLAGTHAFAQACTTFANAAIGLALVLCYVGNTRTRQSVHDLAVDAFVLDARRSDVSEHQVCEFLARSAPRRAVVAVCLAISGCIALSSALWAGSTLADGKLELLQGTVARIVPCNSVSINCRWDTRSNGTHCTKSFVLVRPANAPPVTEEQARAIVQAGLGVDIGPAHPDYVGIVEVKTWSSGLANLNQTRSNVKRFAEWAKG